MYNPRELDRNLNGLLGQSRIQMIESLVRYYTTASDYWDSARNNPRKSIEFQNGRSYEAQKSAYGVIRNYIEHGNYDDKYCHEDWFSWLEKLKNDLASRGQWPF